MLDFRVALEVVGVPDSRSFSLSWGMVVCGMAA